MSTTTYENGHFRPSPNTEFAFHVSDLAYAAGRILGDDWRVESGGWGTCGFLLAPDDTGFTVGAIDTGTVERPLYVQRDGSRRYPLPELTIANTLDEIAHTIARVIRELH
ncbi:hypothetical protein ACFCWY_08650 [Streptomyces sp. NPDC056362]|uniref:hypothetical protein n=1 Tax=unclassified Streptomyces TaxID=2593676 RepID=UPI0035D854D1